MAETATKAAPAAATPVTKPERPDEEVYKKNLAQAEKELKVEEERLVREHETTSSDPPVSAPQSNITVSTSTTI